MVVSLVLMAFSSNPYVREVQNGVGFAFRPDPGRARLRGRARSPRSERRSPRSTGCGSTTAPCATENERLTAENTRLQEIPRENEQLTDLLQLRAGFDYKTAAATVISRDSSEFRRVIGIDKGTNAGIKVGDVVVAGGGALAGRVTSVGPDSAIDRAVDRRLVDGHRPARRRTPRPAESSGSSAACSSWSRSTAGEKVTLGDEVVTAGIELGGGVRSPYPKGLLIGQVVDVRRDANDVVQTAYLQPAADLDKLEFVLVVLDYQGGLPPVEEQPVDCDPGSGGGTLPEGEQPCACRQPVPRPSPRLRGGDGTRRRPARSPALLPFRAMKGIVLAGGTATRLFPLTIVTNKHLLPIYDRPMIYYPIETLAGMGIREVLVIVGGKSVGDVVELLGDGSHFGLDLTYRYQAGRLGHRPGHRSRARLRRCRRVLLRPRRQHPARA